MWDLFVSVPDHCLSFYSPLRTPQQSAGAGHGTDLIPSHDPTNLTVKTGRGRVHIPWHMGPQSMPSDMLPRVLQEL